jgi:hypothetical protein
MVDEVDLLHAIGADLEDAIGEPERWRDEVVGALHAAAQTDPVRLAERREALASMEGKIKGAAERFLTVPSAVAGDVAAALEGMRAERTRLESEVRELSEALAMTADIGGVADEVVSHLRILRLHLVSGERSKVRAVLRRFIDRIAVDFDRDAASASEVTGFRVRYRPDAFTVRNLIPACANPVSSG